MQEFLCTVLRGFEVEQVLILIDKLCVHCAVHKLIITQNVLQEGNICLNGETKREEREIETERRERFVSWCTPGQTDTHTIQYSYKICIMGLCTWSQVADSLK